MTISKNLFCEVLIRDFAKKYLGLTEPFELQDIMKLDIEEFPSEISDDEIYTLADIRYCMRILNLINPFSHIRTDEYDEIDTKEIISYEEYDLKIFLYEIISSLPNRKSYFKQCKNCGRLFVTSRKERMYCYGLDSDNERCDRVGYIKSQQRDDDKNPVEIYSRYYKTNWANCSKGRITDDEFYSWKAEAKNKYNDAKAGKISPGELEDWLKKAQKALLYHN